MKGFRNSVDLRNLLERPKKLRDHSRSFSRLLSHYIIGSPFRHLAKKKAKQTTKLTLPRAFNSKPADLMAMALSHGGFDDDFFAGFPMSALMTGALRNNDGSAGNRGIPLDVKEVRAKSFTV